MTEEKKSNFKTNFGVLANKVKTSTANSPLQEVVPVGKGTEEKAAEAQLNVWIPKDLLKQLKRRGLDADMSLKEMTIKALDLYLNK